MKHIIGLEVVKGFNNDNKSFDLLVDIFVKNTCLMFGDILTYCGQVKTKHCYIITFDVDDRYDVNVYDYIDGLVEGFNALGINVSYKRKLNQ